MEYCPHCIREVERNYCPYCGGAVNWMADPGQLPVGTVLSRTDGYSYQIGAAKGQGGFGITYAGMDLQNGRRVAIKEYYPGWCATRLSNYRVIPGTQNDTGYRDGMRAFLEEAMMLSAVGALPSVVTVYDCFEANGTAYLVMEYVDGSPLHAIVSKQGRFTAQTLLPLLPNLLGDLGILHKSGIIHRDISPDNLILTAEGSLKLLDFGSARSMNASKNMTVLLKPGFSPVEQYQSTGQGPYTDLYAFASTIYYCLTGVIPPASFDRMTNDTLQHPNALGAGLTAVQENALLWALAVRPEDRPATAERLSDALFGKAKSRPVPVAAPASAPTSFPISVSQPPPAPVAPPPAPMPAPIQTPLSVPASAPASFPVTPSASSFPPSVRPQVSSDARQTYGAFLYHYSMFFYRIIAFLAGYVTQRDDRYANLRKRAVGERINVIGSVSILGMLALFVMGVILIWLADSAMSSDEMTLSVFLAMITGFVSNLILSTVAFIVGHSQ